MTYLRSISPFHDEFALSGDVRLPPRLIYERSYILHRLQSPRNHVRLHPVPRIVQQLSQEHWIPAYSLYRFDEEVAQSESGECGICLGGHLDVDNVC
jgi:hypothetical protein